MKLHEEHHLLIGTNQAEEFGPAASQLVLKAHFLFLFLCTHRGVLYHLLSVL